MEWMINTQLGRRNLPPAQRLAVMDKFKKKIQEQAKENMSIGGSSDKKGSPNGETLIKKQTHTDKELAKMAGVGTGTVARFNKVMNSDDEEIKEFNQHSTLPNNSVSSQDDLAKEIGISVDTLQNYKKLTEMIPELEELVDTGITTPTTALAIMRIYKINNTDLKF